MKVLEDKMSFEQCMSSLVHISNLLKNNDIKNRDGIQAFEIRIESAESLLNLAKEYVVIMKEDVDKYTGVPYILFKEYLIFPEKKEVFVLLGPDDIIEEGALHSTEKGVYNKVINPETIGQKRKEFKRDFFNRVSFEKEQEILNKEIY